MEKELNILWMIPKWTLPATDGARVATDRLLKNSVRAGARIDCLFVQPEEEAFDEDQLKEAWKVESVSRVTRIYPSKKLPRLFNFIKNFILSPFTPLTISSFSTFKIRNKVQKELENKTYDILVLDALHLAACFYDGKKFNWPSQVKKIVLREHNFEQELWYKAADEESFYPFKLLLRFQASLVKAFENQCLNEVSAIAAISLEDLEEIKVIAPKTELTLAPLGLDFNNPIGQDEVIKGRFLFVGKLDWPPNKDGLKWFLDNVWEEVIQIKPSYELQVVGSGNGSWLEAYKGMKGLLIQGFIDDIDDAYRPAEFTLIPMRYGSGTRIKVIETYAKGRPIITTKMGIQGADLDASKVLLAETKDEWIELLKSLRDLKTIESDFQSNRQRLAEKFDEVEVGKTFYSWLKQLL